MIRILFAAMLLPAVMVGQPPPVLCGIDVLQRSGFARMRGERIGLITNHTGRTRDGVTTVDAFLTTDAVELAALFSPEHGFAGVLEGKVEGSHHHSGLPIYSLYGDDRKPTAAMLAGLDTLVFDIQDIGCRFYTYVSTMRLAMEAAAEHGLRFFVLDRPNPIGGRIYSGPVLDPGKESFVGTHVLPVRHGMTAGELARMFREECGLDLALEIVACENWARAQLYDDTGLYWIDPSPNMRNLTEALLYPGVGLLEFTNLSVGRGTDTPFERIGAPWLDGRALAARLNQQAIGVRATPIVFTPDASVFAGETCRGVQFAVTERAEFEPLRFGMVLACALRDLHPADWQPERYARLLGDQETFAALRAGASAEQLIAGWRNELASFASRRSRHMLYD